MNSDIAISVRNLSKKFKLFGSRKERLLEALHPFRKSYHDEFWALKDLSFDINCGEIVGVMGRNGSGKSTLLQIICSVMTATRGEIHTNGRVSALLELGSGFNPEFTGRNNVLLNGTLMGIPRSTMLRRLPMIEAFADVGEFFDQPMKTYSSGMFVRVAFAAAIHVEPDILVIDEVLSVGDAKFQHRCFQRIREFMQQGKTIIVVSHDTDTLLRICHRGIAIDAGELGYIGEISGAVNFYHRLLFDGSETSNSISDIPESTLELAGDMLSTDKRDKVFEKPFYNPHETRMGNGSAKIVDIDVIANGQLNPPEIPARAKIEIIVKIVFEQNLEDISVGFGFVTLDGTYAYGTNFDMLKGQLISCNSGEIRIVKFRFISQFTGGNYFLNVGCHQPTKDGDRFIDVRRSIARLSLSATHDAVGFVNLDVDYETIDPNKT